MKKITTLLCCIALVACNAFATVITVSNNANSPGQYTTLQAAIDAATNGDTLYVHGSPTSYGSVNLNRSLTLIGTGYNPQKDLPLVSSIGTLYLDSVPGIKGCSNSSIIGFNLQYLNGSPSGYPFTNILVKLNRIAQVNISPTTANGLIISQNLIDYLYNLQNITNLIVKNNIVYYVVSYFSNNNAVLVTNNFFFYTTVNTNTVMQDFSTISNNIFLNLHPNCSFSTFNNNLIFNSGNDVLPYGNNTGSGNFNGSIPLFINVPDLTGINYSYDYHLTAASPGHNGGTDGTDIGPFGGIDPLVDMTGTPPIPQIKTFNINNTVVLPTTPLDVYVKAKKQ